MNEESMDGANARLRSELRAALPEPPLEEVDWAALRQRIARGAEPKLARLRRAALAPRPAAWWDYAARWAVPGLPAALAAAAALALLLGRLVATSAATGGAAAPNAAVPAATAQRLTVENAIGAAPADPEMTMLYASADRDALLRAAVSGQ